MFGFIGFILIFILIIVLFFITLLGNLVRTIFGLGRRSPKHFYEDKTSSTHNNNYTSTQDTRQATGKKKIFSDDEGEYIDFEEVK